ncbi:MAG: UDP-N-acetylglucosamine 1-carboxyvinyltransferase [Nitrospirae bacterium]|nr:UDP-N-acetylglucosamine 1-carboxyvinyltransferase [Candidatus Troglogloeales bacterium]
MDKIIISGGKPLSGEIEIGGAKNAALPILAATLLSSEPHQLKRVPKVVDIFTMQKLLCAMGAQISEQDDVCTIEIKQITSCEAQYEWVKTMRASVLVLGPLLARYGEAHVSLPGGCAIGVRPINLHLTALSKMGAEIVVEHGMIHAKAKKLKGGTSPARQRPLQGMPIHFEKSTVTGTENIMMAATLAEGTTILTNAAQEPEIIDLACFLNGCGADITGAGTEQIVIHGVSVLSGFSRRGCTPYCIMPDRIETGTFMVAAAITGGDLMLRDCNPGHMESLIRLLKKTGVEITSGKSTLHIRGKAIRAVDFTTMPYPGFPTDMQAQMMALMTVSNGLSKITEAIFESRFGHAAELRRMGAKIYLEGNHAIVEGVKALSGAPVMASDLRASSSLILAGLVAEGETEVLRIYHLDRGYEKIEEKLSKVGADIRRIQ